LKESLVEHASNIQALFINIKWRKPTSRIIAKNKSETKPMQDAKNQGIDMAQFSQLDLPKKLLSNGIVFIWSTKDMLSHIIEIMEKWQFSYIENICVCMLHLPENDEIDPIESHESPHKKLKVDECSSRTTAENASWQKNKQNFMENLATHKEIPQNLFINHDRRYLKCTKKVLLMFRRNVDKSQLELRHQRNPDALFDIVNPDSVDELEDTTMNKIYDTIETLLPKTKIYHSEETEPKYKMIELFANKEKPRKNWIQICQK